MFPRDSRYVQALSATIQFQPLYIHTSGAGDTWHSRADIRWSPPLAQEEQAASVPTISRHIAHFPNLCHGEEPCGGAANIAILANMSADRIATEIQIPSNTSNNVSNTLDSVGILVNGDPLSPRPKRYLHLSLDIGMSIFRLYVVTTTPGTRSGI